MTPAIPIMSGSPGGEPVSNPPQQRGFFSRIGAVLKTVAPFIQPVADRLAAAAGNYLPLELERQQREDALRQSQFGLQQQLQQSTLQNQDLTRQLTQKQIDNYQTPAQQQAAAVTQAGALERVRNENAPPTDLVAPMDDGNYGHYSRSFNQQSGQWEVKPTMVTKQVPNPALDPYKAAAAGNPPNLVQDWNAGPPPTMPATVPQESQLAAMPKTNGAPVVEPTRSGSSTGYDHVWYANGREVARRPEALPPYAQQGFETSNTTTQTGPNGVNQVNQTNSRKTPIGSGAPPPPPPPKAPPNPADMNFKVGGPEAKQMMDQDVALNATKDLISKVRSQAPLFASMLDAGKIQLGADPNSGFFGKILSRSLSPQEAQLAGNMQSLMEHINTLRLALSAQGFRGEEAWNALQAQRGNLMQHPEQIDTTLGNTLQVVQGLLANHQKLLNRPGGGTNAPPASPSPLPKIPPRNADEYLRSLQQQ